MEAQKYTNNNHIFKANSILAAFQLFFFIAFFANIIFLSVFPGVNYSWHINDWFDEYWIPGQTQSINQILKANGWILFYESVVIFVIWSFIFFWFSIFLILRNYFMIAECQHRIKKNQPINNCPVCQQRQKLGEAKMKKLLLASCFAFIMIRFWFKTYKELKKDNHLSKFFLEPTQRNTIDHKHFFYSLVHWKSMNFNTWVTMTLYLLVASTISGFVMMWVSYGLSFPLFENRLENFEHGGDESVLYDAFVRLSPFADTLSYFTQFTNISCLLYALFVLIKPKANFFRNNTATIYLVSYIVIVGSVYWTFLYGIDSSKVVSGTSQVQHLKNVTLASTSILHGSTPILFVVYTLSAVAYNGLKPISFKKSWKNYVIYPSTYGIFMYSLPIFTKISVYGPLTNLNPNNSNEFNSDILGGYNFPENGQPLYIFFAILVLLFFTGVLALFWGYAFWMYKIKSKKIKQANQKLNSSINEYQINEMNEIFYEN